MQTICTHVQLYEHCLCAAHVFGETLGRAAPYRWTTLGDIVDIVNSSNMLINIMKMLVNWLYNIVYPAVVVVIVDII